jgi:hypothetical protein
MAKIKKKREEDSEVFYRKYLPIYNHIVFPEYKERQTEDDCIGTPMYFETYGKELEYVKMYDDRFIWTLIEVDGCHYIVQGFHYVNRLNYLIASVPFKEGEQREFLDWEEVEDVETFNESPYGDQDNQIIWG